eukprot:582040-Pyramimonas_sp.AAC.1
MDYPNGPRPLPIGPARVASAPVLSIGPASCVDNAVKIMTRAVREAAFRARWPSARCHRTGRSSPTADCV